MPNPVIKSYKKISLRFILVVPFVLQISIAVGIVGYLSLRNSQQAVNHLAHPLMDVVSSRIDQRLDSYLLAPHPVNQMNLEAIQLGLLNAI